MPFLFHVPLLPVFVPSQSSHKSCSSCRAHPSLRWEARRFSSLQQVHAWFLSRSISDPWIQMHMLNGSSTAVQTLGDRLSKGDSCSHPRKPWEDQRSSQNLHLLLAALGFLFLHAVPSRAALPTKNGKSLRTSESPRSCCVTPSLCRVPCVICPGKRICTRRSPARISSSGCLHNSPIHHAFL